MRTKSSLLNNTSKHSIALARVQSRSRPWFSRGCFFILVVVFYFFSIKSGVAGKKSKSKKNRDRQSAAQAQKATLAADSKKVLAKKLFEGGQENILNNIAAYLDPNSLSRFMMVNNSCQIAGEEVEQHRLPQYFESKEVQLRVLAIRKLKKGNPQNLSLLIAALKDRAVSVRIAGAQMLGEHPEGAKDPNVLTALIEALEPNNYVALEVIKTLGKLKPDDPRVSQALLGLNHPYKSDEIKNAALSTLLLIHPKDTETLLHLVRSLTREGRGQFATKLLSQIQPNDPVVLEELREVLLRVIDNLENPNNFIQSEANDILIQLKPRDPVVLSKMVALLKPSKNNKYTFYIHTILDVIQPVTPETLNEIHDLLKHEHYFTRRQAISILVEVAPTDPRTRLALVEALKDSEEGNRVEAASLLVKIAPHNPDTRAGILNALDDPSFSVKKNAIELSSKLKLNYPEIIEKLLAILESNKDGSIFAAYALGDLAPDNSEAQQAAANFAIKNRSKYVGKSAISVLEKFTPTPVVIRTLMHALEDFPDERERAAEVLKKIKPNEEEVVKKLIKLVADPAGRTRELAASVLGETRPNDPAVAKQFLDLLKDVKTIGIGATILSLVAPKLPAVHQAMLDAIKLDGNYSLRSALKVVAQNNPTFFIEGLIELLKHPEKEVRERSASALLNIAPGSSRAIDALVNIYPDIATSDRRAFFGALAEVKPNDPETLKICGLGLNSGDYDTQKGAIYALQSMKPSDPDILNKLVGVIERGGTYKDLAAIALIEIKPTNPAVLSRIVQLLTFGGGIQREAISILEVVPLNDAVYRELLGLTNHKSWQVQNAANTVIRNRAW